jgi:hypothetical protein
MAECIDSLMLTTTTLSITVSIIGMTLTTIATISMLIAQPRLQLRPPSEPPGLPDLLELSPAGPRPLLDLVTQI